MQFLKDGVQTVIDSFQQLDLYFNIEVAPGYLLNKSTHSTNCCTAV